MRKRLTDVRLRSAVLRAYTDWTDDARHVVKHRRRIVAAALVLVIAVVVFTRRQLLPLGAGYPLYWIHDHIALPFWGTTWTLFAPYSAVWWSLVGIFFLVWIVTFVTRWSAVRRPHTMLCRWLIGRIVARSNHSDRFVGALLPGIEWLAKRGLRAELLVDVVQFEQAIALREFIGNGETDRDLARRLVRLTNLYARLQCGSGSTTVDRWRAAAVWHQVLMWIDIRGARTVAGGEALTQEMTAAGQHLIERLGDPSNDDRSLSNELLQDLRWLMLDDGPRSAEDATESVVSMSAARRLDDFRGLAEHVGSDWRMRRGIALRFAADAEDVDLLEVLGVVAMSVGLHTAARIDAPSLASAYISTFEALRFLQYVADEESEVVQIARGLSAGAPLADHYRFAGELAARGLSRLANAPGLPESIFDEAVRNEWSTIETLNDAAGPDFGGRLIPDSREDISAAWTSEDRGDRALMRHRLKLRPIPLARRTDPVLMAGMLGSTVVYATLLVALILTFVPTELGNWSHRPLPDNRILENVRRELAYRPFLDAVFHSPDREIVISQTGATLHSFDPDRRVWSTDRPFAGGRLSRPDVRLLTSVPEGSARATLWGVTVDGGLVRRRSGDWEIVIPDAGFRGRDGRPVQHKDLTAVAASPDGRWLALGAGPAGLGIQDLEHRRWLTTAETIGVQPTSVSHVVWWKDAFYVGGTDGVTELTVRRSPLVFRRIKELPGTVLQMEAAPGEGLFVLQRPACREGASDCLRLTVLPVSSAAPIVLIDEANRYPALTLAGSFYAEQWDDHLLLAGDQGLFDYDTRLRSWQQRAAGSISAVGPCKGLRCFFFGYSGGVGRLTPKTLTGEAAMHWSLAGERPSRIATDRSGPVAVLAASGSAFALADKGERKTIYFASSSNVSPERFQNAVTFGDKVLFFGEPGALVHDISQRSLNRPTGVPPWLQSPASIVTTAGSRLFGLEPQGTTYLARILTQQQVDAGNLVFTLPPQAIEGPIASIDSSSANVLRVIDGQGRVMSLSDAGLGVLSGGRAPDMDGARLLDVTGPDDGLAVSTTHGVRLYSGRTRAWGPYLNGPAGERPVEVAHRSGIWYARSDADRLITLGTNPSTVVGGYAFPLPEGRPTDAMASGSDVYLGWDGAIQRYDTRTRSIPSMWQIERGHRVRLKGIVRGEPLSLQNGVARIGSREVARGVHNFFFDRGHVWLTKEEHGSRYLEVLPIVAFGPHAPPPPPPAANGSPSRQTAVAQECLFRNPTAGPGVTELHDARKLPNGLVAATTNAGLRFYSGQRRSWYGANVAGDGGRGAVHALGSALLLSDPADRPTSLQVFRSKMDLPASCASGPVRLQTPPNVVQIRSLAVDERAKRAIAVRANGAVVELTETETKPMLDAPTNGPPAAAIIRSWHFPDVTPGMVWLTTSTHLWHYDLSRKNWSRVDVVLDGIGPLTAGTTIDLQPLATSIAVVAKRATGDFFSGTLTVNAGTIREGSVALSPLLARSASNLGGPGREIVDVQQDGDNWMFLLQHALKQFNPRTRAWQTMATFDAGDLPRTFGRIAETGVVTGTSRSGRTVWWVETPGRGVRYVRYEHGPNEKIAVGGRGQVFRLNGDGGLQACAARDDGTPACTEERTPLHLDPNQVRAAYRWRPEGMDQDAMILFDTPAGLAGYSPAEGAAVPLGRDAAGGGSVISVRGLADRLWVKRSGQVLTADRSSLRTDSALRAIPGATDLVSDDSGGVWARFSDGWRAWNAAASQFVRVHAPVRSLRLLIHEGTSPTAIDPSGVPYSLDDRHRLLPAPYALPPEIRPDDVTGLLSASRDEWWVLSRRALAHVRAGPCQPPDRAGADSQLCGVVAGRWNLEGVSAAALFASATADGGVELRASSGAAWRASPGGSLQAVNRTAPAPTPGLIADRFSDVRPWFTQLDNRDWVFDRPSHFDSTSIGLVAVKPSGPTTLSPQGATAPRANPALDVGWLKWDRSAQSFQVRTSERTIQYSKQDFVREQRLPFESVDAVRALGGARWLAANASGIWGFSNSDLRLDSPSVQFWPVTWNGRPDAIGGRFRVENGEYAIVGGQLDRRPASRTFDVGAVTFFRDVRSGLLAVIRSLDGRSTNAYKDGMFLWDSGRKSVSFAGNDVLLLSDAGVHSLSSVDSFDAGPPGDAESSDRLQSSADSPPRFLRGGRWYQRSAPGLWEPVDVAQSDAVVATLDGSEWVRRGGVIRIEHVEGSHRTNLIARSAEFGLASDRLVDAAASGDEVFLVSETFVDTVKASDTGESVTLAGRVPAPRADAIERLTLSGEDRLFVRRGELVSSWNPRTRSFDVVSDDANPYRRRVLAVVGPLRFTFQDRAVQTELEVEDLRNGRTWIPVEPKDGRFPFDVVRFVAARGNSLMVATAAGLQVYADGDLALENGKLFAFGGARGEAIDRMGEPCSAPGQFVACGPSGCFQQSSTGAFAPASQPDPLSCRVRARSALWSWTTTDKGISGRYQLTAEPHASSSAAAESPIELRQGRFPHDDIQQVVSFDSKIFTIWHGNHVGIHDAAGLGITANLRNHVFAEAARLVLIPQPVPLAHNSEADLGPGLYVLEGPRTWRYAKGAWLAVTDRAEVETVADYERKPPVLQRRRLRLVRSGPSNALTFEMRMPGGEWTPLQWDTNENRPAIDVWQNIQVSDGTLWIATPTGLVARGGDWRFDPDTFRFVGGVPAESGRVITDFQVQGREARIRYDGDSSAVYALQLDERQHPSRFTKLDGPDPFAERSFDVDSRYWTWRLTGHAGGDTGSLVGSWRGEPIRLDRGRFDFDTINSLAIFNGRLHLSTDNRGWFELPPASAALEHLSRPRSNAINPVSVVAVQSNLDPLQPALCLKQETGEYVRLSINGVSARMRGCPVIAAETGFWRYAQDGAAFSISPKSPVSRAGERRLQDGRFSDEVVLGVPVSGTKDAAVYTLIPTAAGVMWLDARAKTVDMHAAPFRGESGPPRTLQWIPGGTPAYLSESALYDLSSDEPRKAAWTLRLPSGAIVEKLGSGPDRLLWADWSHAGRRHHLAIDPESGSALADELPVDGRGLYAYLRRGVSLAQQDAWVRLRLRSGRIEAYSGSPGEPLVMPVDPSFQLLAGVPRKSRTILIGPQELLELNMERIARHVYWNAP
jgi:hypothetical protein